MGGGIQLYVFLHVIQYAPISFFHFRPVFVWYWRTIPFVFSSNRVLSCKCTVYCMRYFEWEQLSALKEEQKSLHCCCVVILFWLEHYALTGDFSDLTRHILPIRRVNGKIIRQIWSQMDMFRDIFYSVWQVRCFWTFTYKVKYSTVEFYRSFATD